jgi:hypothetical protein
MADSSRNAYQDDDRAAEQRAALDALAAREKAIEPQLHRTRTSLSDGRGQRRRIGTRQPRSRKRRGGWVDAIAPMPNHLSYSRDPFITARRAKCGELLSEFCDISKTPLGILFETPKNYRFENRGDARTNRRNAYGRGRQNARAKPRKVISLKGCRTDQKLVKDHPKRPDIGSMIDRSGRAKLLGRHIKRRSKTFSYSRLACPLSVFGRADRCFRDAKINDLENRHMGGALRKK